MSGEAQVVDTVDKEKRTTSGGALIVEAPHPADPQAERVPSIEVPLIDRGVAPTADAPFSVILNDLVDNTQLLFRQEVALAKAEANERLEELKEEALTRGIGVGLLAGSGVFALLGLGYLGFMLISGLVEWFELSTWLSALLVALLYFLIAGVLAYVGKKIVVPDKPRLPEDVVVVEE